MKEPGLRCLFFLGLSAGLMKDITCLSMPILPTPPSHNSGKLWDTPTLPHKVSACGNNHLTSFLQSSSLVTAPCLFGNSYCFPAQHAQPLFIAICSPIHSLKYNWFWETRQVSQGMWPVGSMSGSLCIWVSNVLSKPKQSMVPALLGIKTSCQGELRS